jgi:hypothetical protein
MLLGAVALGAWNPATAQERIPTEEAQRIARGLTERAGELANLPYKTEVDTEKPFAVRQDRFGAMAIPIPGLKAETFAEAGAEAKPIGHFWMRNLTPVIEGAPAPESKLRTETFNTNDQMVALTFYVLGVRKTDSDKLELLFFTNGKEPILSLPIEQGDTAQSYPIEMEGREDENETGLITLYLSGKYRANLRVAPTPE